MIYWVSGSIGSSMRLYFETRALMPGTSTESLESLGKPVLVPVAVAQCPHHIGAVLLKRDICGLNYTIVRYTKFARCGHFPWWEQPSAVVPDIRAFIFEDLGLG